MDNTVPTGAAAPGTSLSRAVLAHSAAIGDVPAVVQYLGLAPGSVGLAQANLTIPPLPPGNYPVDGAASNAALVSVGGE